VLDELFTTIGLYNPVVAQAGYGLPTGLLLLTMHMERHKMVQFLLDQINYYDQKLYIKRASGQHTRRDESKQVSRWKILLLDTPLLFGLS
jgi:hypothetical protein